MMIALKNLSIQALQPLSLMQWNTIAIVQQPKAQDNHPLVITKDKEEGDSTSERKMGMSHREGGGLHKTTMTGHKLTRRITEEEELKATTKTPPKPEDDANNAKLSTSQPL